MRRFLAVTVPLAALALTALSGVAACSSSSGAQSNPTPAVTATRPSADPAAADAALSKDTKAICAQASRTATSFGSTFVADLKAQSDAKSQGAQARTEAKQRLTQDVESYSGALSSMGHLADDAKLKKALQQMSKEVIKLKGDLSKISPTAVSKLTTNLDKACGKG